LLGWWERLDHEATNLTIVETRSSRRKWVRHLNRDDFPAPKDGFVLTHFLVVADQDRSRDFYSGCSMDRWWWNGTRSSSRWRTPG
jgi:hypothetical protein